MKSLVAFLLLAAFTTTLTLESCSSSNKYACGSKAQKRRKNKSLSKQTNFFIAQ